MLVVTRKQGESVILDDQIEVTVLSIEGSQVRLGFNAPSHVCIYRKELYERIQQANQQAAVNKRSVQLPHLKGK